MRILSAKAFRSQSAMEFLMTYGWSILIIAVVLGAMFQLGVFNSLNLGPRAPTGNCKILRVAGMSNLEGTCSGVLPQSVAQFNGQSSVITNPSTVFRATILASGITFSAWIETTSSGTGFGNYIVAQNTNSGCNQACLGGLGIITGGKVSMEIYNGIAYDLATSTTQVNNKQWYHVAGEYSPVSGIITIYVNGVNQGSAYAGNVYLNPPVNTLIGLDDSLKSSYFNGSIANVQIYNTSLDANQVQALYLKGIGAAPIDPNHIIGWWPLNGDVNDYSGNNNNGAASNVVYTSSWIQGYTAP
jgi:Concanavalin A-like lectin/glucanases superfamily